MDRKVSEMFEQAQTFLPMPEEGVAGLVEGIPSIVSSRVLVVGTADLWTFQHSDIREFARNSLIALSHAPPSLVHHMVTTIHGVGVGIEADKALEAQIAGFQDAVRENYALETLQRISIVERDRTRALGLRGHLEKLLPDGRIEFKKGASKDKIIDERTAFVAMPFTHEMDDVYHYGVQVAISKIGYECTRVDRLKFRGDIVQKIFSEIKKAHFMVADLTGANPNVYLEVGYGRGRDIPIILIAREAENLQFNIRGERCLFYRNIQHLGEILPKELEQFKPANS